jgi:acyl-CoA thioesterase I
MRLARTTLLLLTLLAAVCACGQGTGRAPARRSTPPLADAPVVAAPASVVAVRTSPMRVLFVGASVTRGVGASSPDHAYPAVVVARLQAEGRVVRPRVMAQSGIVVSVADSWDLAVPADLVVVQLATNDFAHSELLPVFRTTYNDVLRRVREASPRARLLCMGGWNDPGAVNRLGLRAADYDAAAWAACTAEHGRYLDLSETYRDPRNHGPVGRSTSLGAGDEFHPNDRGHLALAALVLATQGVRVDLPDAPPAIVAGGLTS